MRRLAAGRVVWWAAVATLVAAGIVRGREGRAEFEEKSNAGQEKKEGTRSAPAAEKGAADMPAAKPEDVKSLDAIVAAVYDVISGPPGERDWNRFHSLFAKDARLIAVRMPNDGGKPSLVVMTPGDYTEHAGAYFKQHGFFEHELSRKTDSFGAMTHIYTTYESRETKDGKPIDRGINSMEFFFDGQRWWCVEIYWDSERPGNPIPEKYLGK